MFFKEPIIQTQQYLCPPLGRPDHYPIPDIEKDLLFYVQRNHNENTIIYSINRNQYGIVDEHQPMKNQWIRYSDDGSFQDLSILQQKLIYGFDTQKIAANSFEFGFHQYPEKRFFIDLIDGVYQVFCKINSELATLTNIYAHADHIGTFPQVKCLELYGKSISRDRPVVQKILF